ncbi:MAG: hypothetical protein ACJ789_10105 [Thermomicrobiales bacterium]
MSRERSKAKTYLWCATCRRSYPHEEVVDGLCPVCHQSLSEMGKFSAILRGLMANELVSSDLRTKHRQLVRLIWTRNGMGERYYRVLTPDMAYNKFEARVTELLCRGAEEGWVKIIVPPAPSPDDSDYKIEFDDEERFVRELEALVSK